MECPKADCERAFVLLSSYVRHVGFVHAATTEVAWTLPKIIHDGRAQVPYLTKRSGGLVNADAPGECGDCPKDGYALPAHPNCQCQPEEGWKEFLIIAEANRPENWNENEWREHIETLRREKGVTAA